MSNQLLEGLVFLDFSHRLPGPLASHYLVNLGATVYKIEDREFKDPFISGLFGELDDSFRNWYEELNRDKDIIRLDFKSNNIRKELKKYLEMADGVLLGLPEKLCVKLGLTEDLLKDLNRPLYIISLLSSKSGTPMHDLNALQKANFLPLHLGQTKEDIIAPPLFPIAGGAFAAQSALKMLAGIIKTKKENKLIFDQNYLLDSVKDFFSPFYSEKIQATGKTSFLHNGVYPCYSIYRLKDNSFVAMATVEEKFWIRFCEIFNLKLTAMDRFNTSKDDIFSVLSKKFLSLEKDQVKDLLKNEEICIGLI